MKINKVDEIDWFEIRYQVISDFPNSNLKIGDIIKDSSCIKYPNIFKPLKWYEGRTMEELYNLEFCKIIKTKGYWEIGDILPVCGFLIDDLNTLTPKVLLKGYGKSEEYKIDRLIPATLEEFMKWKTSNNISINP